MKLKTYFFAVLATLLCVACQPKVDVYTSDRTEQMESSTEVAPEPVAEEAPPAIHRLQLNITGNGTVTTDSELIPGEYRAGTTFGIPAGTALNFMAAPDAGWKFDGWSDACTGDACSVMIDGEKTVTASFSEETSTLTYYPLAVRLRNSCPHEVSVMVEPPGEVCLLGPGSLSITCSYSIAEGTTVQIIPNRGAGCYTSLSDSMPAAVQYYDSSYGIIVGTGSFIVISFSTDSSIH